MPRLKIGPRSDGKKKFLVVRGDLSTYEIHLGSGNVVMEPNDEYLCIVPAPGRGAKNVFLPFEEDTVLSVILSKAFLPTSRISRTKRSGRRSTGADCGGRKL